MKGFSLQSTPTGKRNLQLNEWSTHFTEAQLNVQPFPRYERAKRVSHSMQMTPQNLVSSKWNHGHLDSLLKKSQQQSVGRATAQKQQRPFQTSNDTKYPEIKNMCKYGFTNVFPLVPTGTNSILKRMLTEEDARVEPPDREGNDDSVERPLHPEERLAKMLRRRTQMDEYHSFKLRKTNKLRLKLILQGAYPHGVQGVENPESKDRSYCGTLQQQTTYNQKRKTRANFIYQKYSRSNLFNPHPDYSSFPKETFDISPTMKSKKHIKMLSQSSEQNFPRGGKRMNIRPVSHATYNIISNHQNA